MTAFRVTAIMKTDIVGSTPRFRSLAKTDLSGLLAEHREFVSRLAAAQEGRIFKAGGDGFWITFPSVTAAGLAAMAMQEELRRTQSNKGDDRLAMRIVITLGDVLDDEGDLFGDAVALADRIEAVTPADETYMSAAARLAVNQAEVRTALVDAFALKGFTEPVPVYRIEQTHHTQVIAGQYIVVTDLNNFSKFLKPPQLTAVEDVLERLLELVGQVCREFGGTTRFNSGDAFCLTFTDADRAMAATERLAEKWELFNRSENLGCPLVTALHKGALYLFRSHVYSADLMVVSEVMNAGKRSVGGDAAVFVTGQVRRELADPWQARLRRLDVGPGNRDRLADIEVFRLGMA
jgi:class 3 adenylate cyclase